MTIAHSKTVDLPERCREAEILYRRGANHRYGVAWFALDPAVAERLWRESLQMLGR